VLKAYERIGKPNEEVLGIVKEKTYIHEFLLYDRTCCPEIGTRRNT